MNHFLTLDLLFGLSVICLFALGVIAGFYLFNEDLKDQIKEDWNK